MEVNDAGAELEQGGLDGTPCYLPPSSRVALCAAMLLLLLGACLPLPLPDFRRPATLIVFSDASAPGLTVQVCTWSTHFPLAEGCDNIEAGMPALDGVGVPEYDTFPLVLRLDTPLWGDLFVACEGPKPRGATLRLPDLRVKWDAAVEIVLDAPSTRWGEQAKNPIAEADVERMSSALCAGTAKLRD